MENSIKNVTLLTLLVFSAILTVSPLKINSNTGRAPAIEQAAPAPLKNQVYRYLIANNKIF